MIFLDIENIETENGLRWSDLCMEAPIIKPPDNFDVFGKRKKRQTNSDDTDDLGMVSNKMSVTTIFELKHFKNRNIYTVGRENLHTPLI